MACDEYNSETTAKKVQPVLSLEDNETWYVWNNLHAAIWLQPVGSYFTCCYRLWRWIIWNSGKGAILQFYTFSIVQRLYYVPVSFDISSSKKLILVKVMQENNTQFLD